MKKITLLIVSILLITGCQKSASTLDIKKASSALDEKYSNMTPITNSELESVYNMDLSKLKEYTIKISSDNNGDFYALIKVDSNSLKDVEKDMDGLFSIIEKQSNLYSPEAAQKLKNKTKTKVGDYLIYIASDDNTDYYSVVKDYIN